MKTARLSIILFLIAFAFAAAGCSSHGDASHDNQSAKEVEKEDGSTVAVSNDANGTRTEVRTFESGEVARVTRVTPAQGNRTATVEFRDGRKVELKDESAIEEVMDASGDAIVKAANVAWEGTKEIGKEVGDKTEDVAGKAADVGKDIGKGTKSAAEEVGDKTEDAAGTVKKGAKKVGKETKKVGEKIKDAVTP